LYHTTHPDDKAHEGITFIIRSSIKHYEIDKYGNGYDWLRSHNQSNSAEAARNRNKIHHPTMQCSLTDGTFFHLNRR